MGEMFTPEADLSGTLEVKTPLYVSHALHKAFIEVNEDGSEAAAATSKLFIAQSFSKVQFIF